MVELRCTLGSGVHPEPLDEGDLSMTVVENDRSPLATATAVLAAIEWPLVTPP